MYQALEINTLPAEPRKFMDDCTIQVNGKYLIQPTRLGAIKGQNMWLDRVYDALLCPTGMGFQSTSASK